MQNTVAILDQFENHLARQGKSTNTIKVYSRNIRAFLNSNFTDPLEYIMDSKKSGASPSVMKSRAAALKSWSGYRADHDAATALDGYRLPRVGAPRPHPVPGGIRTVRGVLAGTADPRTRVLIALGALAGTRVSESLSVAPRDWDRRANELVITGKGGKTRNIPVSAELAAVLIENMPTNDRAKFVHISDRQARNLITGQFNLCNVYHPDGKNIASHDLRATFATELYEKTKDIILVQRTLGHASPSQTQEYIGVNTAAAHEAVNF